jgi:predicted secreted acid phosphatase
MKPKAIIVNIDGTVADCEHRRQAAQLPNGKMCWPTFFKNIHEDKPITATCELVSFLSKDYSILFVTGRSTDYQHITREWLQNHVCGDFHLYERSHKDYREDVVVKREIYEKFIQNMFDVRFVLDDRNSVVKMWRELGLTCYHVAEGDF